MGSQFNKILIAAKADAVPGVYLLKATKLDSKNLQSEVPPLNVLIRKKNCTITPSSSLIYIPVGGRSLPLILDFSSCMPISDVSVTANLLLQDNYNISLIDSENKTSLTKTITFSDYNNTKIFFLFESQNASSPIGARTLLNFVLGGTNKNSYNTILSVVLQLSDPEPYRSIPTVIKFKVGSAAGKALFYITCSATGLAYFALGLNEDILKVRPEEIRNKTGGGVSFVSEVDKYDIYWKAYGFSYQMDTKPISIEVGGVKAGGSYRAVVWCSNQLGIESLNPETSSWVQADNGGRLSILDFTFVSSVKINLEKRVQIACALATLVQVPFEMALTQEGIDCNNVTARRLQTSKNYKKAPIYLTLFFSKYLTKSK